MIATIVEWYALGLSCWFWTWGLNRIYLKFKSIVEG